MLLSSHDQIRITAQLLNKQPGQPSEDKLTRSPRTKDVKKKPLETGNRAEMQKGPAPHPWAAVENQEGYLSSKEARSPNPTLGSPTWSTRARRRCPI